MAKCNGHTPFSPGPCREKDPEHAGSYNPFWASTWQAPVPNCTSVEGDNGFVQMYCVFRGYFWSASPLSHTWQITRVVCGNTALATAVVPQGALQPAQYLVSRVADVLLGRGSAPAFHVVGQVGRDLLGSVHIFVRSVHVCRVWGPGLFTPGAAFWREKASVQRSQRFIQTPGHQSHP